MFQTGKDYNQEANFLREAYHKICKDLRGGNTLDLNNPLLHNKKTSNADLELLEKRVIAETRQVNRDLYGQRVLLTEEFLKGVKKTHFAETSTQSNVGSSTISASEGGASKRETRKKKKKTRWFRKQRNLSSALRHQEMPNASDPATMLRGRKMYAKDQNMSMSRFVSKDDFRMVRRCRKRGELPQEHCRANEFPTVYADALSRNKNDLRARF